MDEAERAYRIGMGMCKGISRGSLRRLVRGMGTAAAVWNGSAEAWAKQCPNLRKGTIQVLDNWRRQVRVNGLESKLKAQGIWCLVEEDPLYPTALTACLDRPLVLFARGKVQPLRLAATVAVIGTRRASSYGLEAARWIAQSYAEADLCVVSGLALGIDAAAHISVLEVHGYTVAVLGTGVDVCYPPSNRRLYERISANGMVLSEYPPGTGVEKYQFPERNRWIAALSRAVVVVQAGEKSGALRTVDAALDLGREVYVVPGPITSVHYRGSNQLLQQGAHLLLDPKDSLIDFGVDVSKSPKDTGAKLHLPDRWAAVLDALDQPRGVDFLAGSLLSPPGHMYALLLEMELAGLVKRVPGGVYARV